jgi:hypothetical protein
MYCSDVEGEIQSGYNRKNLRGQQKIMTHITQSLKPTLAYPNANISKLCATVKLQLFILKHIKSVLPDQLAAHVLHCVPTNKKLLIYTDSANWATQLRFYDQKIIAATSLAGFTSINNMQVKITDVPTSNTERKRDLKLPPQSVVDDIYRQGTTSKDPELSQALVKLSLKLGLMRQSDRNT